MWDSHSQHCFHWETGACSQKHAQQFLLLLANSTFPKVIFPNHSTVVIQNNIFIVQWVISPCIFDWNRFNFHQTLSRPWQKYKAQTYSLDQKAYKFQKCHYIEVLIRIRYFKAKYSKYLTYLRVINRCYGKYTLFSII